jgi:membrane protein implicated in regulation of membrane protease activity
MTDTSSRDWHPSGLELIIWNVIALALFIFALGIFTNISSGDGTLSIDASDLVTALISLNALLLLHEFIHGQVMRRFGGKPQYGLKMIGRVVPVAYVTSPGSRFDRQQFLAISLAPFLLITIGGLVLVGALPNKSALPLALAVHTAGCIGDLWMVGVALRQPAGTTYEDRKDGIRFHYPEGVN